MSKLWSVGLQKYKEFYMLCAPGTHEAAAELLTRHRAPKHGVLDLATGTGALLARLRDRGFSDFAATELDPEKFGPLEGVKPRAIDLNGDFSKEFDRKFNVIIAVEIIEHLEFPRHFLQEIRSLLNDGGYLLLSTPNVSDWSSRLKFLVKGELRYFDEWHYQRNGHISPFTDVQLRILLKEVGLTVVDHTTAGSFFGPLKKAATAPLRWAFRLVGGKQTTGDVNMYLLSKTAVAVTADERNAKYYLKNAPASEQEKVARAREEGAERVGTGQ